MSKEIKRKRYSLGPIILLLTIGSVFTALGIALTVIIISSIFKSPEAFSFDCLLPFLLVFALLGFGMLGLIWGGKMAYNWIRYAKASRSKIEAAAKIVDSKTSYNGSKNRKKRYALKLSYELNGENKTFTTDYLYDQNEYRYLKSLKAVKIKIDGNFAVIAEIFTIDIYKVDSTYGIDLDFFKQKHVSITFTLWRVFFAIAIALLALGIVLSLTLDNRLYAIIGTIIIFAVNPPFAIISAIFLIQWIRRIK